MFCAPRKRCRLRWSTGCSLYQTSSLLVWVMFKEATILCVLHFCVTCCKLQLHRSKTDNEIQTSELPNVHPARHLTQNKSPQMSFSRSRTYVSLSACRNAEGSNSGAARYSGTFQGEQVFPKVASFAGDQIVNISSDAAMTTMPVITLLEVTRLWGSYLRAVGMSSITLMYICMSNTVLTSSSFASRFLFRC
jgi:hypothetical protein